MAACPFLRVLVTTRADDNTLRVFDLPVGGGGGAAAAAAAAAASLHPRGPPLGGADSPSPLRFNFTRGDGRSGYLAFTGTAASRLLLVTDAGHDAVHVVNIVTRVHAGYVAAPGTITGPRGVAARGSLVAVSAWKVSAGGDHVVHLFEGTCGCWAPLRLLAGGFGGPGRADGQLSHPYGLRFTSDGTGLAVADWCNDRVSMFLVEDGSFARHTPVDASLRRPYDVEECDGGWLVACCGSDTVEFISSGLGEAVSLGRLGDAEGEFRGPSALALVPGVGLVVKVLVNDGLVQGFV
jgi:hypothetical protein